MEGGFQKKFFQKCVRAFVRPSFLIPVDFASPKMRSSEKINFIFDTVFVRKSVDVVSQKRVDTQNALPPVNV